MKKFLSLIALGLIFTAGAHADDSAGNNYEITVTNITRGQSFTPILVATHKEGVSIFTEGSPASPELAILAEGGDTAPLTAVLVANANVHDVITIPGRLDPGKSVTVKVKTKAGFDHVSLASMLIPTNDGFIALEGVQGPKGKETLSFDSPGYDAGSEPNDELCANIPGPVCGGEGASIFADGEGFVHINAGIHGIGNLIASERDWRNPTAHITIRRVR